MIVQLKTSFPVLPGDWPDYLSERPLVAGPVRLHGPGEQLLLEAGREAEVEVVLVWTLCSCSTSPEVEVVVRPPQPRQHLVVVQGVVPHDVKLDSEHCSVVTRA